MLPKRYLVVADLSGIGGSSDLPVAEFRFLIVARLVARLGTLLTYIPAKVIDRCVKTQ
jgi:hypothetical protein